MTTTSSLPQPQQRQVSGATIVAGSIFLLALFALGYYMMQRNRPAVVPPIVPPNNNENIPGYTPPKNAGANAMGVLTDPNFFDGLKGLATTIADLVKKNPAAGKEAKKGRGYENAPQKGEGQQEVETTRESTPTKVSNVNWGGSGSQGSWSATNF